MLRIQEEYVAWTRKLYLKKKELKALARAPVKKEDKTCLFFSKVDQEFLYLSAPKDSTGLEVETCLVSYNVTLLKRKDKFDHGRHTVNPLISPIIFSFLHPS